MDARGDLGPASFDDAFAPLYVLAVRVGRRITGSPEEAEDVAAETLARTLVAWKKVHDLPYIEAWVQRVAVNLSIDVVRRRRPLTAGNASVSEPEQLVAERLWLVEGLRRLTRRQREVVVMRYLLDLPEAEVAEILRVAPGSVKRHATRALAKLRIDATSKEMSLAF